MPETFAVTPSFATLGTFDLGNVFTQLGFVAAALTIFSFMLTDFLDTTATATAIVEQAGLVEEDGNIPDVGKLLFLDSLGTAAGVSSYTAMSKVPLE